MTQIFTGQGLGLQGSSLGLGNYGPKGVAALGQGGDSVYVNAANGNLLIRESDGFLADIGFGLDLFQFYNSRGESNTSWCFNIQSRLQFSGEVNKEGSSVTLIDEDGHSSRFLYDAKKQAYLPEEGGTSRLSYSQNGWTYKAGGDKTSFHYNQQGQLQTISDSDGHLIKCTYENGIIATITDLSEKQKIVWSFENGLVTDLTTYSEGLIIHHLHYDYDAQNRLHKVSRDLGQDKQFWITYDYLGDSSKISDIKQSDGVTLHIEYDAEGRVKKLVDGEGRATVYNYELGKTTITNDLGEAWTYYYDDKNRLTGIDGPEQYRIRYQYESNHLSRITQGNQVWKFTYNDEGDCISIEEPTGQITKRVFDAAHRLIMETHYQAFDGSHNPIKPKSTRYLYDEGGHLLFLIAADGTVTEMRYDGQGQRISSRCYLLAAYDVSALAEEELLTSTELQSWVSKQNPQAISLVDYVYDWRGQLSEEIHYTKVDASGLGLDLGSKKTRSRYDASGRLVEKSILGDTGWIITQYFYDDLGRLTQTIDNQQNNQFLEYDEVHHRITQTNATGLKTISIYDNSGLLLAVLRLDKDSPYGSVTYQYDAAGRLISETGVDGKTQFYFYDKLGRLHAKVCTNGQVTEYSYSEEGYLVQTRQYEHAVSTEGWLEKMPEFSQIKPKHSNQDRVSQNIYDQYNKLAYVIDAQGAVIAYTYDAEGHVISTTAYATRLEKYDPEQLLSFSSINPITNSKDRNILYYYDSQGRLEAKINGEGYAESYSYDRLGNLIKTCSYYNKAQTTLSGIWSLDKPEANTAKDRSTYSIYDGSGLKIADIDAEGYLTEYSYNDSGFLKSKCAYEQALSEATKIDPSTTLESIRPQTHSNDHHSTYLYNNLGQLAEEKSNNGLVITYEYDAMGSLITKTLIDAKTQSLRQQRYRYDALGRLIQSLDELGSALLQKPKLSEDEIELIWQRHSINYEYNIAGLLIAKTNALKQTTRYFYDEARQLRYTINADGAVIESSYNSFGQIASIKKYSTHLKADIKSLNTDEITAQLELIQNELFDETITYEYNTLGLMIAKHSGTKGLITSSYNAFGELNESIQRIDSENDRRAVFDYDRRGLIVQSADDVGGITKLSSYTYDSFGWINQHIDGRSKITEFKHDKRGIIVGITNANNQSKTITYDAFGRVLEETDYSNTLITKSFSYDDTNNTITLTSNGGKSEVVTEFNAFGDKIFIKDANGNISEFHYDEKGQLTQIEGPLHAHKDYHYDVAGRLEWQLEDGGRKTSYSYDAEGRVLTKTIDPDGLSNTTSYQYDAIGRVLQITDANKCSRQFIYDNEGHLIQSCIDPDGLNLVTEFTYDDRGLLIQQTEINPQGTNKVTAYQWDHLGRKIATIKDPQGLKLTTSYQYDANDNLICQTDANQHSTHYIYDANNQCRYQIDPCGVVTEHIYTNNGEETQTITYAKPIPALSHYDEASLKLVLREDSIHDQYQFCFYDTAGRLERFYDSLGYATFYFYDANGNVIQTRQYAVAASLEHLKHHEEPLLSEKGARDQYFVYDGLNRLRFKWDNKGIVTQSLYCDNGALKSTTKYANPLILGEDSNYTIEDIVQHVQPNPLKDKTSQYTYDKAGRLITELSPEGVAKSYQYDGLGNLIASTQYATRHLNTDEDTSFTQSPKDRTIRYIYDNAGRELYRITSEGRVLERAYDSVGNIINETTHSLLINLTDYTEETIKKALTDEYKTARQATYKYDAAGRLLSRLNPLASEIKYTYDAEGNVLSKTEANKALWTYNYDEANQLIETISPPILITTSKGAEHKSVITRNSFDSFGNIISQIRDAEGLKQTLLFEYDNSNQKIKTTYPDVKINNASEIASNKRQETTKNLYEEIQYNAFQEVIATSDKAGNWRHCSYDNQGLLIYSIDTKGGLTQYKYDSFGQVIEKTQYAQALNLPADSDHDLDTITNAITTSEDNRHEFYEYNLDGQLIKISRDNVRMYNAKTRHYDSVLEPTTKIEYNAFGEVTNTSIKINESDWAETYNYYDQGGKKTATINAKGYLTTFTHNSFGEIESIIEYNNTVAFWSIDEYTNPNTDTKDRKVGFTYDALGQVTSKTLKQITYQSLTADLKSYETKIGDLTTTYGYDALGNCTTTTDAKGNTSYCYYNEVGQLIAKVAPTTQAGRAATTYAYNALGQLVATTKWVQGVSQADSEQFTLKGSSTDDITTTQVYDNLGQLIAATNGLQHRTEYSYDANGNLARSWKELSQLNSNDKIIQDKRYTYDSEHHLLQTATFKNKGGIKTEDAHYNSFGELTAKGIDGKFTTKVEYDKLGRVWRSNTQGYYQIFLYDLTDDVTQIITSTNDFQPEYGEFGVDLSEAQYAKPINYNEDNLRYEVQRQDNLYDALGHLEKQIKEYTKDNDTDPDPSLEHITQSQTTDRWGNRLSYTNANGFETLYEYNAFNQVIKQELPEVRSVDEHGVGCRIKPVNYYAYDALGQAIALMDANGHIVTKDYDAMGRIIKETDGKGNQRTKSYNLLDQLSNSINEKNALTTYTYDKENRLTAIQTPKTHQEYEYDEEGQLLKQKMGTKTVASFEYDSLGNQVKRYDQRGNKTEYEYDDTGRKTKETDAENNSQSWLYNQEGQLQQHTDLGGHTTTYEYNTNGLLLKAKSTKGKNLQYHYQGDGQLIQFADINRNEVVNFSYDDEGQVATKRSSRGGDYKGGWVTEIDHYQYDALGRLTEIRRRNPDDIDNRFPDKDKALLSIDYEYDAVGNIRHTQTSANYANRGKITSEDYYTYDENDRMIINKGQLVNGQIGITSSQGSELKYDAAGNITDAIKYEQGSIQKYHYEYDLDNRLEEIKKNSINFQKKMYDEEGRIYEEHLFDETGKESQTTILDYVNGLLKAQHIKNANNKEVSKSTFDYDKVGNLKSSETRINAEGKNLGCTLTHKYTYELWDSYQQKDDEATSTFDGHKKTTGKSTRVYDVNGLLEDAIDMKTDSSGNTNTTHYWNSSLEGLRARKGSDGQTSYLIVDGQVIGDFQIQANTSQHLNIYGGFTPTGTQKKSDTFLNRDQIEKADGTLPELPQDNLGAYTVQAGDTLQSIALQIYGDSNLWYLLADANGITDKNAKASNSGPFQIGQRLNVPPASTGQHHTNKTHKVLNSNTMIGNTNATTPLPLVPPPLPKSNNSIFAKIVVAIVCTVATVLTAGIMGALAGLAQISSLSALFTTGLNVLAGGVMANTAATLGAGFTAGFVGNMAGQSIATALGMQENIDLKGALITGLTTAATAGLTKGLNASAAYQKLTETMESLTINKAFSITTAAEMMEQNAATQALNLSLRSHQYFDWEELGVTGITAGLMGSKTAKDLQKVLNQADKNTGILTSQLQALTQAATQGATGTHFNATQVLTENLGNALANGIIKANSNQNQTQQPQEDLDYCPIPEEETYSPIPEGTYQRFHEEAVRRDLERKILERENKEAQGYESLVYNSELFTSINTANESISFKNTIFLSGMHGWGIESDSSILRLDALGFSMPKEIDKNREINYSELLKSEDFKTYVSTIYGEAGGQGSNAWEAIANVVNNRIGNREWSKYKTPIDIIKHTGFDAYSQKTSEYMNAYNSLMSGKLGPTLTEMIQVIAPVYLGLTKDTTNGAVLYYSPKAQRALASRLKEYKEVPNWDWNKLNRVYPTGVEKNDFAFYKYK